MIIKDNRYFQTTDAIHSNNGLELLQFTEAMYEM